MSAVALLALQTKRNIARVVTLENAGLLTGVTAVTAVAAQANSQVEAVG